MMCAGLQDMEEQAQVLKQGLQRIATRHVVHDQAAAALREARTDSCLALQPLHGSC